MTKIKVKILGTGVYLPSQAISSEELEKKLGFAPKTFQKTSGVNTRYHASGETSSEMGVEAGRRALKGAGIDPREIDAVISVSGVPQQAIPFTAAFLHQKLGLKNAVAFDINSSCLSFLTGLDCMGNLIAQGVYRNVLLVSSEIASCGLNPGDPKTASLFGDGAAAVVLGPSEKEGIIASYFEMKSDHVDDCQCEGGGSLFASTKGNGLYFRMNGPRLFRAVSAPLLKMVQSMKEKVEGAIDLFIPHQASPMALALFQKKLGIPDCKFINVVREYGNMVAASIPFALHKAIEENSLKRGDRVLLFGTGAGLTIGGVLLEY